MQNMYYIAHFSGPWKKHKYVRKENGKYYYPNNYKGGGRIGDLIKKESDDKKDYDPIKDIAGFTGMKEESIKELQNIANKDGYDSDKYKELASTLAEGDPDQEERIKKALQKESGSTPSKKRPLSRQRNIASEDNAIVKKRKKVFVGPVGDVKHSDELTHHGVLGMKWGIRRYQRKDGTRTPLGKKRERGDSKEWNRFKSEAGIRDSKALRKAREKNLDKLSTKELKEINDRLNAEEQYVRLTKGDIGRGKDYAKGIAVGVTTSIVTGLLVEAGKAYVKNKMKGG